MSVISEFNSQPFSLSSLDLFLFYLIFCSWLIAQQPLTTTSCPPTESNLFFTTSLPLCSGLDMEERTREMKLKMNKYKQGAGSDSRLEQGYHKVRGGLCALTYMLHALPRLVNMRSHGTVGRHMAPGLHLVKRTRTHTRIDSLCTDSCAEYTAGVGQCENTHAGDQRSRHILFNLSCYCKVAEGER